jgi:hypothetical protein
LVIKKSHLNEYSDIFSLFLSVIQAQEAMSRIILTTKWKTCLRSENVKFPLIVGLQHYSQSFLAGLQSYYIHTVVNKTWGEFEDSITLLADEASIKNLDLNQDFCLKDLNQLHETCLDSLKSKLMLHPCHEEVSSKIKELLQITIKFSKFMQDIPIEESLQKLYFDFQTKLKSIHLTVSGMIQNDNSSLSECYQKLIDNILFFC